MFFLTKSKMPSSTCTMVFLILIPSPLKSTRKMASKTLIILVNPLEIWLFLAKKFFSRRIFILWSKFWQNFFLAKMVKFLADLPIWLVFSTPFFEYFSMVMELASKIPSYTSRRAFYSLLKKHVLLKKDVLNMFF